MADSDTADTFDTDLRARAEALLEFPKVKELLAGRAHFFLAHDRALAARPVYDLAEVDRLQSETAEGRLMLDTRGDIGLGGMADPRPSISRASLGGVLAGDELIAVASVLDGAWQAASSVRGMADRAPLLALIAGRIGEFRKFKEAVLHALSERGDILDRATPRLGGMRRRIATSYNRLARALERMTGDAETRQALQSGAIATRGDRLVLEVRIENRKAVPGIVHDVSKTGQTLFVEPFAAVDLCNDWREAAAEAAREEERVLMALTADLAGVSDEAMDSVDAAGDLDLILSRARLAQVMRAERPEMLPDGSDVACRLTAARHPLLGGAAVPLSAWLGPGFTALVITGPNTGGKTVALKTVGLLALMHQAGLQLPAATGTAFRVFDGLFADIGDAQSIERSVSTFSSHMGNVARILEEAGPGSLVLIDELGTGTDPEEGAALARSILDELVRRRVPSVVTTHHRTVAQHAGNHAGMENASVELDPDTMLPTYHLVMGIPGRSYAISVARRLGLPEGIVDGAQSMLSAPHVQSEELLRQLQAERNRIAEASAQAEADRVEASRARRELDTALGDVRKRREDLVERTRREMQRSVEDLQRKLKAIERQARAEGEMNEAREAAERLRREVRKQPVATPEAARLTSAGEEAGTDEDRSLAIGDWVEVKGLEVRARIEGFTADGRVDLLMGNVHVTLDEGELRFVEAAVKPPAPRPTPFSTGVETGPAAMLDLRGVRAHEVEEKVDAYLDRCVLSGMSTARILHGHGTGAVRQAVREALARHPSAAAFSPAEPSAGGDAITVVELG